MSTYYAFRNPMKKQELEAIGVTFQEGEVDGKPHTWIVEKEGLNYLHPLENPEGDIIYGFTRYGGNNPEYLLDILDDNGIGWVDEYTISDWQEAVRDYMIDHFGLDAEDDETQDLTWDALCEIQIIDCIFSNNPDEFIKEWCEKNKEMFQNLTIS